MSTHVVTEFRTSRTSRRTRLDPLRGTSGQPRPRGLRGVSLRRNQDDATNIFSFTQWASRRHYDDYLAWRTEPD